jgi:hypothetical protein
MLNRLGHGISYSQLEEIDTALCLKKLTRDDDESRIAIPSNILPCIPATLAYDNIDRCEETLEGSGTSHRVNGIAVQQQVATVRPREEKSVTVTKQEKRRSIDLPKSSVRPYNAGVRVGPTPIPPITADYQEIVAIARDKNYIWSLVRQVDENNQIVSSWTGFNILTRNKVIVSQDNIGYLPTINAPATELSTVNEILLNVLKIKEQLNLPEITCVFDQALYAKACEVIWKHSEKFKTVILRMGVFHTICNMLSILGRRYQDAGLRDLDIESGVIAEGSIGGVLDGRRYNRGVRLHKLVYEAMLRLAWKGFYSWLEETHCTDLHNLQETTIQIEKLQSELTQDQLEELLQNPSCRRILQLFNMYMNFLRSDNGDLSAFWMSYMDMVEVVLGLIRASREGNWQLHLAMISEMIPWTFAYDKQNYAR